MRTRWGSNGPVEVQRGFYEMSEWHDSGGSINSPMSISMVTRLRGLVTIWRAVHM